MLKSELLEKIDNQIYWKKNVGDYPCFTLSELIEIKKNLEILNLIIKWKNNYTFCYDIDCLDNEEIIEFKSEIILVQNYIYHHFGYIPKCFNKVGDSQ